MNYIYRKNFCILKDYISRRDHLISGVFSDGSARFVISDATHLINQKFNNLNENKLKQINIAFNTSLIMNSFLCGEERIKLLCQYEKNNNLTTIYAESICTGEIRGFIEEEKIEEDWDQNYLKISKILYNHTSEVFGILKLEGENLEEDDVYNYFEKSEQTRTHVYFKSNPNLALGFILQKMPDADDILLEKNFIKIIQNKHFREIMKNGLRISELSNIFKDIKIPIEGLKRTPINFYCRCSKDQFINSLKLLGKETIS